MKATQRIRLTTTLALLREKGACTSGYKKLLKSLPKKFPDDKPINLLHILKSNDVADCLWAIRAVQQEEKVWRRAAVLISCSVAERAVARFEERHPDDKRPRECLQAARDYIDGKCTLEVLRAKRQSSWAAAAYAYAYAAYAYADADADAAYAAADAADAADADAADAAADAADAADADAADAAADAAYAADAYAAARRKEVKAQAAIIRKLLR